MARGIFRTPAPWGVGPGPARVYSVSGALASVDMWLELTPDRPSTRRERDLMQALRDVLAHVPDDACEADLQSAKRAIKGMVKYAHSREALDARIASYMRTSKRAA